MADVIDLRSDTVTRPTPEMREAIANAVVDDDVLGADPTVAKLEQYAAELLGKEAAVFMPSGTMTNQAALRVHCQPGDEFICEAGCHIYNYEQGAFAQLSGLVARTIPGEQGILKLDQLRDLVLPENDHFVRTRLVCLENTHNRGGGKIFPLAECQAICEWARAKGLATHLDGARLFNAVVATGVSVSDWAKPFDTISICLSKGLGAPVGSLLVGSSENMKKARRCRKLFGGGMRQSGIIAAGGLYALENNIDRLAEDHRHAKELSQAIDRTSGLNLVGGEPDTNILFFEVDPAICDASQLAERLEQEGILVLAVSPTRIRAITHLGINDSDIHRVGEALLRST